MTEHLHSIFLKAYDRKYRFIPAEVKILLAVWIFVALITIDIPQWSLVQMDLLFLGIVFCFFGLLWTLSSLNEAWHLFYYLVKAVIVPFLGMWTVLAIFNPSLVDKAAMTFSDAIYIAILRVERIVSITLLISSLLILVHPEDVRRMFLIRDTKVAVGIAVFFRFVPVFFQDVSEYIYSINERGTDLRAFGNWIRPRFWAKQVIPFLSKSLVLSFNQAEWMNVALSVRQSITTSKGETL
jgi:energy-coupling factor transporter transmembrane protein EcfT